MANVREQDLERAGKAGAGAEGPGRGACTSADMSAALKEACGEVQRILNRNDARDAFDRYQVGCVIRNVRNAEHSYGQGAVGKIARAVGRDVDTLYEYADVAETWSQLEITRLLERKTLLGVPLSFTHLVVLSKVRRDRDLLKALTDRAIAGLSARHLRALVDEQRRERRSGQRNLSAAAHLVGIVRACSSVRTAAHALEQHFAELQAAEPTAKLALLLQQAHEAQAEVQRLCEGCMPQLAAERARVQLQLESGEPAQRCECDADGEPAPEHLTLIASN